MRPQCSSPVDYIKPLAKEVILQNKFSILLYIHYANEEKKDTKPLKIG